MQVLRQDLRQAFRLLRRNPGFALTAIATLALGIGATVAVFSSITALTITYVTLTGGREPERVRGNYITPNTFDVPGVQPIRINYS